MADPTSDTPAPPESPEGAGPVHYQISITGRQAAAFFLMLLAVLGLAFFFGMKTGAAAKKGPDAVSRIAGVSDLAVAALPSEEKNDKNEKGERMEAAPAATPEPSEKKLGFEDAAPASAGAARTPPPAATPAPEATKSPAKTPAKATPKPPGPTPEKGTQKAAEKTPEKPSEKPSEKTAATKAWHVQVFATKDGKKADDLVKKLKGEGFKADVAPSPKTPDLFVVRVGPFGDKAKAEAQRKKILKSNPGLKGLMVVPS